MGVFFERRFQPLSVGGFFSNQRESISRCPKSPFPSKTQNRQIARTSPLSCHMCIAVLPIFKSKQKLKTSLGTLYHECVCVCVCTCKLEKCLPRMTSKPLQTALTRRNWFRVLIISSMYLTATCKVLPCKLYGAESLLPQVHI